MLLLLIDSIKGRSLGVGPSQTVVALVGDNVTLPCHFEPAVDAVSLGVEWGRPDLEPRFVHVWYEGRNLLKNQNPSYKGRTSVSMEKLRHGDLSLSLSAVKLSDNGAYRCYFISQDKHSTVELVVGSFSSPLITHISKSGSEVVLQCESEGWYPEPEVLWLDSEGKVFSDGPTETLKGPDGLFTVSSRVTVEKREGNIFTCRVHQRNINRTRETHIQISVDFFETSSPVVYISIMVVLVLGVVCAAAFVFWKWRQNQIKEAKLHQAEDEEREQLMAKKVEDLEQRERRLEDSQNDLEEKQKTLEDSQNDLEKKRKTLEDSQNDLEEKKKRLEEDLWCAESDDGEKEGSIEQQERHL
ncbi:butyrophilin subfamily 3 member A2-like [Notolabrus celidotus]|uniref:butyrophilin subfamily 3 member A2-like n=1 Tax=Notolabrus celidotus TaxID=1203425 RepID=UPI0014903CA0|nr:butyrophilin subfamily 3 member A2-like [Notolabrus celidotus]